MGFASLLLVAYCTWVDPWCHMPLVESTSDGCNTCTFERRPGSPHYMGGTCTLVYCEPPTDGIPRWFEK